MPTNEEQLKSDEYNNIKYSMEKEYDIRNMS